MTSSAINKKLSGWQSIIMELMREPDQVRGFPVVRVLAILHFPICESRSVSARGAVEILSGRGHLPTE